MVTSLPVGPSRARFRGPFKAGAAARCRTMVVLPGGAAAGRGSLEPFP